MANDGQNQIQKPITSVMQLTCQPGLAVNEKHQLIFDAREETCEYCILHQRTYNGCECPEKEIKTIFTPSNIGRPVIPFVVIVSAVIAFLIIVNLSCND